MLEVILVKYFASTCRSTTHFILWIVLTITGKYIQWFTTDLFIEVYSPQLISCWLENHATEVLT